MSTLTTMKKLFGFELSDIKDWGSFVKLLTSPRDGTSLAIIRILFVSFDSESPYPSNSRAFLHSISKHSVHAPLTKCRKRSEIKQIQKFTNKPTDSAKRSLMLRGGLLMIFDTVEERGMAVAEMRWGNSAECRFPLVQLLRSLALEWMYAIYLIMIVGAVGIALGFHYRKCCLVFALCFWYIIFLDKSSWNNHSYLFGLTSLMLLACDANQCWSVDRMRKKVRDHEDFVPLWNYSLFRAQVFIVFFVAGLKKLNADWLFGYSMRALAHHWIFDPFKILLTVDQIDHIVVHIGGFLIDISMGFLLFFNYTRMFGLTIGTMFHVMNSCIFHIGMFPYAMIVLSSVFCDCDWPKQFCEIVRRKLHSKPTTEIIKSKKIYDSTRNATSPATRDRNIPQKDDDVILKKQNKEQMSEKECIIENNKNVTNSDNNIQSTNEQQSDNNKSLNSSNVQAVAQHLQHCKEKCLNDKDDNDDDDNDDIAEHMNEASEEICADSMNNSEKESVTVQSSSETPSLKNHLAAVGTLLYIALQLFLPFSQPLTPGFSGWNTGLYGYSWDMMINSWNLQHIRISFQDPQSGVREFIDPDAWVNHRFRWSNEVSMIKQYAVCIRERPVQDYNMSQSTEVYMDIWISLNDRFQQRLVRPDVDIAGAYWSPFKGPTWLLPLLSDLSQWRTRLDELEREHSTGKKMEERNSNTEDPNTLLKISSNESTAERNYTVVFMADFSGLWFENYIQEDLEDVTMELLQGSVILEYLDEDLNADRMLGNQTLNRSDKITLKKQQLHRVHTVSDSPSCLMIKFYNSTQERMDEQERIYEELREIIKEQHMSIQEASKQIGIVDLEEAERIYKEGENRRLLHSEIEMTSQLSLIDQWITERYRIYKKTLAKAFRAVYGIIANIALWQVYH